MNLTPPTKESDVPKMKHGVGNIGRYMLKCVNLRKYASQDTLEWILTTYIYKNEEKKFGCIHCKLKLLAALSLSTWKKNIKTNKQGKDYSVFVLWHTPVVEVVLQCPETFNICMKLY